MKKGIVFCVVFMVVVGACFAQNATERKFIGTWTDIENSTWVFSADGNLTFNGKVMRYTIIATKMAIFITDSGLQVYDFFISDDGKTIILTGGYSFFSWSVAGPGWPRNWLTKK